MGRSTRNPTNQNSLRSFSLRRVGAGEGDPLLTTRAEPTVGCGLMFADDRPSNPASAMIRAGTSTNYDADALEICSRLARAPATVVSPE